MGWARARPVGRAPDCLHHQLQHLDLARVPSWIEGAAQVRQRVLRGRIIPFRRDAVWPPQGKMTMSGDMPIVMHNVVNTVLGAQAAPNWKNSTWKWTLQDSPSGEASLSLWRSHYLSICRLCLVNWLWNP